MTDRGQPREQYQRTYVLLPPSANAEWALAVVNGAWDKHRFTIGSSADDAGIGDLDVRRIIAVNPDEWGDLRAFYKQYYPGVQYHAIEASTPRALEIELKLAEQFDWQTIEPDEPEPDAFPIRGVHDLEGAAWMHANGLAGWATVPVYLGTSMRELNFSEYATAGIRIVVSLRYSWAKDDAGGQGTMPSIGELEAFENACVYTMRNSKGAWGWIYCNEVNNPREWPKGFDLNPAYYLASYNRVWSRLTPFELMSPASLDPYNAGWGDWRETWKAVLDQIRGADFWALHSYSHGIDFDPNQTFGDDPLKGVFYNLRVLESQLEILPFEKPVIITETNHGADGSHWSDDSADWLRGALEYFGRQGVAGVTPFRFNYYDDRWRFGDYGKVLDVLRDAG